MSFHDSGSDTEKVEHNRGFEPSQSPFDVEPETERRLVRKLDMRIVPSSMMIYFLCFLDRSNIGNAKVLNNDHGHSLLQTLRLSDHQYLTALMIFLVSYTLFETPSNYLLKKFKPSRWLALLMFFWGAMTLCLGAVHNFAALTVIRFLLGMFEAGLFPGLVYFLTFWYKPDERALRVALILACATLAGAFGGAIAYGVGKIDGTHGLEAWRWLFIFEGIPSCLSAILVLFFFPNFPEDAKWLNADEKNIAVGRLRGMASLGHARVTWDEAKETLVDWRLYLHYLAYISISVPFSSISLFSPTIVSGLGYSGLDAQLFTVPPYAIAFIVTVTIAWLSDKYEARSVGTFLSLLVAGVTFIVQGVLPDDAFRARFGLLCVAVSFSFAAIPPLLSFLTANLRSTTSSTLAIPLNVSIGQIGQIIGVYIYKADEAPGYPTGHFVNAGFLLVGACVMLVLRLVYVRRNRKLVHGEQLWRL